MLSSTSSHASVQIFSGNCCFLITVFSAKNKAAANHVILNSHTSSNVCFCVVPFIWIFLKTHKPYYRQSCGSGDMCYMHSMTLFKPTLLLWTLGSPRLLTALIELKGPVPFPFNYLVL